MKRTRIQNWLMSGAAGAIIVSVMSCSPASDPFAYPVPTQQTDPRVQAANTYKQTLESAIMNADKIVIEEHSNKNDFAAVVNNPADAPKYTYARRELSPQQKEMLLDSVRRMNPAPRTMFTNCLFVPHHSIRFYSGGQLQSVMKLCYQCGETQWNGSSEREPEALLNTLTPTVRAVGLHPYRDWVSLAQERYKKEHLPPLGPGGIPVAKKVPGKPGFVFNPFTQNEVDVDGIPAGTKVRDPHDPDESHIFRVP